MTSFWSWVKVKLMKKLLMIMGLSLLFSGSVHAKDVYLVCYADNGMPDISIVINDDTQTIIIDGNKIKPNEWNERIIKWGDKGYERIDRITGVHGDHTCSKTEGTKF